MASAVYILCAITAMICAYLLLRAARQCASRFLMWSGLCFVGMSLSNIVLFIDLAVTPNFDWLIYRQSLTVISMALLVYGLVMETVR